MSNVCDEYVVLSIILSPPVFATPSDPLPPEPDPGCPAPLYCVEQSSQPFAPDYVSVPEPGNAIKAPDTFPDNVIENCDTVDLLNAKV